MKNIYFISLMLVAGICCHKEDIPKIYNNGILGKWELTEYYVNPGGGPSDWQAPDESFRHTLEFQDDGDFITNAEMYYGADAYEVIDSSAIKFLNASQQVNGTFSYFYSLEEKNSVLIISPMCYEGCAYKYRAIK